MPTSIPILCLDFDGVLHSYTSGWTNANDVPDDPVPGAMEFLLKATQYFNVAIFSSRSHQPGGMPAMKDAIHRWLVHGDYLNSEEADLLIEQTLMWPKEKPPAFVSIDDRAIQFVGVWPDPKSLREFKPWRVGDGSPRDTAGRS